MIPYDDTEHGSWYWLWTDGPEGLVWMLVQRQTRWPDGFMLPHSEGCEVIRLDDGTLSLRGKWTILEIHPCNPPEVTR